MILLNGAAWLVGAIFVGLLVIYFAVRLAGSAWYRSRREHLQEIATLFARSKRSKVEVKGEDDGGQ